MNDAMRGLDQLQELPLPAPIPYWPQTWGWAVVAMLLLASGAWAGATYWRRHRRNLYRRQALAALNNLAGAVVSDPLAARDLPALLKRTALTAQADGQATQVAALDGQAWVAYLSRITTSQPFPDDSARLLATLAYAPDEVVRSMDPSALKRLIVASRRWMEHHHVAA